MTLKFNIFQLHIEAKERNPKRQRRPSNASGIPSTSSDTSPDTQIARQNLYDAMKKTWNKLHETIVHLSPQMKLILEFLFGTSIADSIPLPASRNFSKNFPESLTRLGNVMERIADAFSSFEISQLQTKHQALYTICLRIEKLFKSFFVLDNTGEILFQKLVNVIFVLDVIPEQSSANASKMERLFNEFKQGVGSIIQTMKAHQSDVDAVKRLGVFVMYANIAPESESQMISTVDKLLDNELDVAKRTFVYFWQTLSGNNVTVVNKARHFVEHSQDPRPRVKKPQTVSMLFMFNLEKFFSGIIMPWSLVPSLTSKVSILALDACLQSLTSRSIVEKNLDGLTDQEHLIALLKAASIFLVARLTRPKTDPLLVALGYLSPFVPSSAHFSDEKIARAGSAVLNDLYTRQQPSLAVAKLDYPILFQKFIAPQVHFEPQPLIAMSSPKSSPASSPQSPIAVSPLPPSADIQILYYSPEDTQAIADNHNDTPLVEDDAYPPPSGLAVASNILLETEHKITNTMLVNLWDTLSDDSPHIKDRLNVFLHNPTAPLKNSRLRNPTIFHTLFRNALMCYSDIYQLWAKHGRNVDTHPLINNILTAMNNVNGKAFKPVTEISNKEIIIAAIKGLFLLTEAHLNYPNSDIAKLLNHFSLYIIDYDAFANQQVMAWSINTLRKKSFSVIKSDTATYYNTLPTETINAILEEYPFPIPRTPLLSSSSSSSSSSSQPTVIIVDDPPINDDWQYTTDVDKIAYPETTYATNAAFVLFLYEMFKSPNYHLKDLLDMDALDIPSFIARFRDTIEVAPPELGVLLLKFENEYKFNIEKFISEEFSPDTFYLYNLARFIIFKRYGHPDDVSKPGIDKIAELMHIHGAFHFNTNLFVDTWNVIHDTRVDTSSDSKTILAMIKHKYPEMSVYTLDSVDHPAWVREANPQSAVIQAQSTSHDVWRATVRSFRAVVREDFIELAASLSRTNTKDLNTISKSSGKAGKVADLYQHWLDHRYTSNFFAIIVLDLLKNKYAEDIISTKVTQANVEQCIWAWWRFQLNILWESAHSQHSYLRLNNAWRALGTVLNDPSPPGALLQTTYLIVSSMASFVPASSHAQLIGVFLNAKQKGWYYSYPQDLIQGLTLDTHYQAMIDRPIPNLDVTRNIAEAFKARYTPQRAISLSNYPQNIRGCLRFIEEVYYGIHEKIAVIDDWLESPAWYAVAPDFEFKNPEVGQFIAHITSLSDFVALDAKVNFGPTISDIRNNATSVDDAIRRFRQGARSIIEHNSSVQISEITEFMSDYLNVSMHVPQYATGFVEDTEPPLLVVTEDSFFHPPLAPPTPALDMRKPWEYHLPCAEWKKNSCSIDSLIFAFFHMSYLRVVTPSSFMSTFHRALASLEDKAHITPHAQSLVFPRDSIAQIILGAKYGECVDLAETIPAFLEHEFNIVDGDPAFSWIEELEEQPDDSSLRSLLSKSQDKEFFAYMDSPMSSKAKLMFKFDTHDFVLDSVVLLSSDPAKKNPDHYLTAIFMVDQSPNSYDVPIGTHAYMPDGLWMADPYQGKHERRFVMRKKDSITNSPKLLTELFRDYYYGWDTRTVASLFKETPLLHVYRRILHNPPPQFIPAVPFMINPQSELVPQSSSSSSPYFSPQNYFASPSPVSPSPPSSPPKLYLAHSSVSPSPPSSPPKLYLAPSPVSPSPTSPPQPLETLDMFKRTPFSSETSPSSLIDDDDEEEYVMPAHTQHPSSPEIQLSSTHTSSPTIYITLSSSPDSPSSSPDSPSPPQPLETLDMFKRTPPPSDDESKIKPLPSSPIILSHPPASSPSSGSFYDLFLDEEKKPSPPSPSSSYQTFTTNDDDDELDSPPPSSYQYIPLPQRPLTRPVTQRPLRPLRPIAPATLQAPVVQDEDILEMYESTSTSRAPMKSFNSAATALTAYEIPIYNPIDKKVSVIPLYKWKQNSCPFDATIAMFLPVAIYYRNVLAPFSPSGNPYDHWIKLITSQESIHILRDKMDKIKADAINLFFHHEADACRKGNKDGSLSNTAMLIFQHILNRAFIPNRFTWYTVMMPDIRAAPLPAAKVSVFANGTVPASAFKKPPNLLILDYAISEHTQGFASKHAYPMIYKHGSHTYVLASIVVYSPGHYYTLLFSHKKYPYYVSKNTVLEFGIWTIDPHGRTSSVDATKSKVLSSHPDDISERVAEVLGTNSPMLWVYMLVGRNVDGRSDAIPNVPTLQERVNSTAYRSSDATGPIAQWRPSAPVLLSPSHGRIMTRLFEYIRKKIPDASTPEFKDATSPSELSQGRYYKYVKEQMIDKGHYGMGYVLLYVLLDTDRNASDPSLFGSADPLYINLERFINATPSFLADSNVPNFLISLYKWVVFQNKENMPILYHQKMYMIYLCYELTSIIFERGPPQSSALFALKIKWETAKKTIIAAKTMHEARYAVINFFLTYPLLAGEYDPIVDKATPETAFVILDYLFESSISNFVPRAFLPKLHLSRLNENFVGDVPVDLALTVRSDDAEDLNFLSHFASSEPMRHLRTTDVSVATITKKLWRQVSVTGPEVMYRYLDAERPDSSVIDFVAARWPLIFNLKPDFSILLYTTKLLFAHTYKNVVSDILQATSVAQMITVTFFVLNQLVARPVYDAWATVITPLSVFAKFFYLSKFNGRNFLQVKHINDDMDIVLLLSTFKNPTHFLLPKTLPSIFWDNLHAINDNITQNLGRTLHYGSTETTHTGIFDTNPERYNGIQSLDELFVDLWETINLSPLNVNYDPDVTKLTFNILKWLTTPDFLITQYQPLFINSHFSFSQQDITPFSPFFHDPSFSSSSYTFIPDSPF